MHNIIQIEIFSSMDISHTKVANSQNIGHATIALHTSIHYRHSIKKENKFSNANKSLCLSEALLSVSMCILSSVPKSEFIILARSPDLSIKHSRKDDYHRVFLLVGWATFKSETKGASNISDMAKANEYDSSTKPRNITLCKWKRKEDSHVRLKLKMSL